MASRHPVRAALAAACTVACGTGLALGQKVTFNPSLLVDQGYSSNVEYVGAEAQSDTDRRIAVELPYERETASSTLRVSYRPAYVRQHDFSAFDRDEHRFDLRWATETSRNSRLRTSLHFLRSQVQGSPEQAGDPELFLTERNDRDVGRAELVFTHTASARWTWELRGNGAAYEFRPIDELVLADEDDADTEDRIEYGTTARLMRTLSRNSSLGLRYDYRRFELDVSGDDDNHGLAFSWDSRLSEQLSLSATLGAFHSRGDTLPDDGEKTGAYGELRLSRAYERLRLEAGVEHRPSSGGAIGGTSELTAVDLAVASHARRVWRFSVGPGAARREPNAADSETIHGYGLNGFVERRVGAPFALRLRANWYDQSNQESIFETGLAFLWYPMAGTKLGGIGG